jgi:phosphatidylglycerophosphate synthase
MFDRQIRRVVAGPTHQLAGALERIGICANQVTLVGLGFGIASAGAYAAHLYLPALGLWLANRLLDGLDGALARRCTPSDLGGFLDIVSDFLVYGAFLVGVAIALPHAALPAIVLFCTYYVSGTAFLALSSLLEKRRQTAPDCRSLHFVGGIAEGFETVVVYILLCLFPSEASIIIWIFAGAVGITALQRVGFGVAELRRFPATSTEPTSTITTKETL